MWKDIEDCLNPFKKAKIKEMIANLQPIITAYEDTIQYVLQKSTSNNQNKIKLFPFNTQKTTLEQIYEDWENEQNKTFKTEVPYYIEKEHIPEDPQSSTRILDI